MRKIDQKRSRLDAQRRRRREDGSAHRSELAKLERIRAASREKWERSRTAAKLSHRPVLRSSVPSRGFLGAFAAALGGRIAEEELEEPDAGLRRMLG